MTTTRPAPAGRLALAGLFVVCGLATFVSGSNYFRIFPANSNALYEGGLAAAFLVAALLMRRGDPYRPYWPLAYAFFVATMVWMLTTLVGGLGNWALRLFDLTATTPAGVAVAKVGEAAGTVAIILALSLPAGLTWDSLFLKRGNLKWAMIIGLLVILNFTTAALMATAGLPRSLEALGQLLLWGVVFSAANGFVEELWFRGLFLGRLAPHIGTAGAVIVTAIIFALAHVGAVYVNPAALIVFLINTFTHALVMGYLILKTDTSWGAVLYHMACDIWLFIGPLGLVGSA